MSTHLEAEGPTLWCSRRGTGAFLELMADFKPGATPGATRLRVEFVPVLSDNYCYVLIDVASGCAALVDPAEPEKVLGAVKALGVRVTTVLTTHKHWDHAGGNAAVAKALPGIEVVGGEIDNVEACTKPVKHGESVRVGALSVRCLLTPGHTLGHMCYYVQDDEGEGAIFTGDALFCGGCGRIFEGSAEVMCESLYSQLASLPPATKMWCGHEYTEKNFLFAATIEKENPQLAERIAWVREQRARGLPTVPSTIAAELATNPFLRCDSPAIQALCECVGSVERSFAKLRKMKDKF